MMLHAPLRFEPLIRRAIWGGRRLETELGKDLPPGDDYAESWEVVDHHEGQSCVSGGAFAGWTLHRLLEEHGRELLGASPLTERFPLLFKYLDAQRDLSVQVHPNDQQGAQLDPPDLGKTEAWVVLAAEPGSQLYVGLKPGIDHAQLTECIAQGTTEDCLHSCQPQPGDCYFIPAGTVHAIGGGLLIAEIQQSSNTTYRLFDWNRLGPDGQSRPLHVAEALAVIDFQRGPVCRQTPEPLGDGAGERLVRCDRFTLDRWQIDRPRTFGGDDRFHLISVLEGAVTLAGDPTGEPLRRGQTALVPAAAGVVEIAPSQGNGVLLDMYLP